MVGLFINYRQRDAEGPAGRLYEWLETRFAERVFRDIEIIQPGETIAEVIERDLARADLVLALIGPNWLDELTSRQDAGSFDYVAYEIQRALECSKPIIPVVVDGRREGRRETGTLPPADRLPETIRDLTGIRASALRELTFQADADELADRIESMLGGVRVGIRRFNRRLTRTAGLVSLTLLVSLATVAGLVYVTRTSPKMSPGDLNVAVAGWQLSTTDDGPAFDTDAIGTEIGNTTAGAIRSALLNLNDGTDATDLDATADVRDKVWGPSRVGVVAGADDDERRRSARALGDAVGADLVVYGTAEERTDGRFDITVSFVLLGDDERRPTDPVSLERGFPGRQPVDVQRLRDGVLSEALPEIARLPFLIAGLRLLDLDEPAEAATVFQELATRDVGETSAAFTALVDLLLGLTYSRLAEITDPATHLQLAVEAYRSSSALDPSRRDAELGMLGCRYLLALPGPSAPSDSTPSESGYQDLMAIRAAYRSVLDDPGTSPATVAQATTMIGQIDLVLADRPDQDPALRVQLLDQARQSFQAVVDMYASGRPEANVELEVIASGGYAGLGQIALAEREWASAIDAFEQARRHSSPFWRSQYSLFLGSTYRLAGQPCEAADVLREAIAEISDHQGYPERQIAFFEVQAAEAETACSQGGTT